MKKFYLNNMHLPESAIYILPFDNIGNSKVAKMVIGKLKIDSVTSV